MIKSMGWLNLPHSLTLPPQVTAKHRVVEFQEMRLSNVQAVEGTTFGRGLYTGSRISSFNLWHRYLWDTGTRGFFKFPHYLLYFYTFLKLFARTVIVLNRVAIKSLASECVLGEAWKSNLVPLNWVVPTAKLVTGFVGLLGGVRITEKPLKDKDKNW